LNIKNIVCVDIVVFAISPGKTLTN